MNVKINNLNKSEIDKIIQLYKRKKFDDALILSNKLLKTEKNVPFLFNLNGLINLSLENWENSVQVFQKAIDCDDKFVEAYNNMGIAYSHLGKEDKAIENYNKAIEIKKDYSNAYNNLATHYDDLGKYDQAVINYVNALKFNSDHLQAQNNLIHLMNFFNPLNDENNSIIRANHDIKNIDTKISILNKISIKELNDYLIKCNQILKKNLKNLSFFDSQIHRRNGFNLNCDRHHKAFNKFKIIPKYCFGCIKVQINLTTVVQLLKLYFIFDQISFPNDNIRKSFIELRPGIPGTYKGLVYCESVEEAQKIIDILEPYMTKLIENNFNLSIKRGCTEFDLAFPGYKDINNLYKVNYDKEWKNKEELIDEEIFNGSKKGKKFFSRSLSGVGLGDILVMNNWLNYAKLINDETYKNITSEIFFSEYIFQAVKRRNNQN